MTENNYAISLNGITKTFGSVVANDNIDLSLRNGEILALLGENGAGKTTLMNMLSGIYKPDSGQIYIHGEEVSINSPEDSKALGIGMVHQHFKLVENFSAADNIWVGNDDDQGLLLDAHRDEKIRKTASDFGFEINPRKMVRDMSVSEKQTIEILKVLYYGAEILILDEPTAVLTHQETQKLFAILRKMSKAGYSIIIITHKLNEVMEISDRVTIMRKGQSIGTVNTAEVTAEELTNMMVGHQVELAIDRPECSLDETLMEIRHLSILNEEEAKAIDDISFEIRRGEILGVAGVSGCGQKELCEALAGLLPIESGEILYKGEHIEKDSPREIIKRGISMSFIPEDRLGMGLAASMSITDNMMLKNYVDEKGPLVNRKKAKETALKVIEDLEVVTPGTETPVRQLSGGNVQKVLLGREIMADPSVLITAYPVRGLDINASYVVYDAINEQKKKGAGILFVGEDLDVMLELCDKIMVLCHGKVTGIVNAKDVDKAYLGLLMTDALSEKTEENAPEANLSSAAAEEAVQADLEARRETPPAKKKKKRHSKFHKTKGENPNGKRTAFFRIASAAIAGRRTASAKRKKAGQPLLHVTKRDNLTGKQTVIFYISAVLIALILGAVMIACMGVNPLAYYGTLLTGSFKSTINISGYLRIVIPLAVTSLGISYAFKMKFWNIGGNGQFIIGAIGAAGIGLLLGDVLPGILVILLAAAVGMALAGLYGLIPAVLKIKFNTNETLMTLMLNYIAMYILAYLKYVPLYRKVSASGQYGRPDYMVLPKGAWLPSVSVGGIEFDLSLIVLIVLAVFTWIYFTKFKQGYEISVIGDSQNTARYAGMNVNKIVLRTMFMSAAIVGLGGMMQVSGTAAGHILSESITNDVGFTGIICAWLGKLHAGGVVIVAMLLGILEKGATICESTFKISSSASAILEGIILFTVLAADFFIRYKISLNKERKGE